VALDNNGRVIAWGANNVGQLGRGTCCAGSSTPQFVLNSDLSVFNDVKFVTASNETSYAVKNDGTIWAWGSNDNGQIGDGTTTNRYNPVQVSFPPGVTILVLIVEMILC
jgi:alpha-tubulin suppressor-like RCC1 family protein